MSEQLNLLIGGNRNQQINLNLSMANRHGLIAGATGTGKTVTLQVLAEGFSREGVPCFMADVKGDLSGLASEGKAHKKVDERLQTIGIKNYQQRSYPVVFWDLYGRNGHPIRTTLSEFGPLLLANFLDLNETQTGLIYTAFKIADDEGLLLLDLKDIKAILNWLKDNRQDLENDYGGIASSSIATIQRKILTFEEQGGELFFGEPALELSDLIKTDMNGFGVINILDATKLIQEPKLYAIFLLWLLSELFEQLPEVGDLEKPKMVFFFDEAHLLFDNAPKILLDKIEQVVRLIRSKGVGIYFISQSPADIPEDVLGQLGNRIQHALRAFTPNDQRAVRVAAQTFRANPSFDIEQAIKALAVGEALVSVLDQIGSPTIVERTYICPPESRIGPLTIDERNAHLMRSDIRGRYDNAIDRESAYEILKNRSMRRTLDKGSDNRNDLRDTLTSKGQGMLEAFAKSAARSIGSSLGRQIVRGILGTLLGKR